MEVKRKSIAMVAMMLAIVSTQIALADMLLLKNGEEYEGRLVRIKDGQVVFYVADEDTEKTFPLDEVQRINLSRMRAGWDVFKLDELGDERLEAIFSALPDEKDYPLAGYITLYEETFFDVAEDLSYTERVRSIRKVLKDRGRTIGLIEVYYLGKEETMEIDFARTIDTNRRLHHLSDMAVEDSSVHAEQPDYCNLRRIKFALREVNEGAVVDYQVTRKRRRVDHLHPFFLEEHFRYREPMLEKVVKLRVPAGIEFNTTSVRFHDGMEYSVVWEGGYVVHTWRGGLFKGITDEHDMPARGDFVPKAVAAPRASWRKIGAAYTRVLKDAAVVDASIADKVNELTSAAESQEEKARALYNYVAAGIRYVAVTPPQFSYIPRPAGVTFERKAGNVLDKAVLLYAMLRSAGIPVTFVWVRPRSQGRVVRNVPSLGQFSVPLLKIALGGGKERFVSPSLDTVPFDVLPDDYQAVYGLAIKGDNSELILTPLASVKEEAEIAKFNAQIDLDGKLVVEKTLTLHGQADIKMREQTDKTPEQMRKEMEMLVGAIHPNARLRGYSFSNLKDLSTPVSVRLEYEIENYALKAGEDLMTFRLPEIQYSAYDVGRPTREFPLDWKSRYMRRNHILLRIPEGFRVYYAPEGCTSGTEEVSYSARLKITDGVLEFEDEFRRETIFMQASQYPVYKECLETMAKFSKEWIVLEREK